MQSKQQFHRDLVDKAYDNLRLSSFGIFVNATVLASVLYGYVDSSLLLVWYILVVLSSLFRFISYRIYKKDRAQFSMQRWEQIFYTGLISSSILFGLTPIIFFVSDSYPHQAMVIMVIAGLSAGGVSSLSSLREASQLFLLLLIVPLIIKLSLQDSQVYYSMTLLVTLYLILMFYVTKQFHKNYLNILTSKNMYEKEREKLKLSQERFEAVFKQAPLGIVIYNNDLIIKEINQEFIEFMGVKREEIIEMDMKNLPDQSVIPALEAAINNIEGFYEGEYFPKFRQNKLWINMHTAPLRDINNRVIGGIGMISDITQRMRTQLQYEHQAQYDFLTDIPNRSTLLKRIEHEILRYQRHDILFGVMFLDLDHFKNINDSLGHAFGDKLLIETAHRLEEVIRQEDTVARIGGDEFVILFSDLSTDTKEAARKADHIAQQIQKKYRKCMR